MVNAVFAIIAYFMIGLRMDAEYFFGFVLVVFLATQTAESISFVVSAMAATPQQAGAIAPIFIVTAILFGGFFINEDAVPVWLSWLKYLSYIKYSFAALMQLEYDHRDLDQGACRDSTSFCPPTGDAVLSYYGVDDLSFGANLVILIAMAIGVRFLAYAILRRNGPVYDTSI